MDHNPSSPTISSTSTEPKLLDSTPTKKQPQRRYKYKGIVPQPNGRWGAQLYQDSKRVWIGTFDCQQLAAHAYDIAAIRFRGPQALTNYPLRHYDRPQLEFLASHSKLRIIDMLRNQTYEDELTRFMRARTKATRARRMAPDLEHNSTARELLFEKVLTPSDVGTLHRLVIPKHYARCYLPWIADVGGMMLSFEDERREKIWRFKYCYWKSSQNYVLTKGWGEFVKDRGLRCGDVVVFYTTLVGSDLRFSIDTRFKQHNVKEISDSDDGSNGDDEVELLFIRSKILRLFGVDICNLSTHTN